MALFRKFFYRKPPDGLLEISERVFVFDCCFTTDILDDNEYKVYMDGIVNNLREYSPGASFMVFNFREGEKQTQIAKILSDYDMTVLEYPRHYESCPLLTVEVIHHFLRSSESWLSVGQQNILLMHCELGGWPVLAFMLAALLIYRKQYTGEQKTLDMIYRQAPHELLQLISPLNPLPSQLRYLQYVSRRNVGSKWPPLDRALTLDCIILRYIPTMDGEGGCRPIFRIYGQDPFIVSDRTPKVLFSTPKRSKTVRHYKQADCEFVKIDIHCHILGDVVLECISLGNDLDCEAMMFRVMFNTAFIRSNILMLSCDDIDVLWDAKDMFPKDFRTEVLFSEMDAASALINIDLPGMEEKGLPIEAFSKVQEMFSNVDWLDPKTDVALSMLQQINIQEKLASGSPLSAKKSSLLQELQQNNVIEKLESGPPHSAERSSLLWEPSLERVLEKSKSEDYFKSSPPVGQGKQLLPSLKPLLDVNSMVKKTEPQEPQFSVQRPTHSKIISPRMPQTSLTNPASYRKSLQGFPMPIPRYHSATSALGITALLHDHKDSENEEITHQITTSSSPAASDPVPCLSKPLQPVIVSTLPVPPSQPSPSLKPYVGVLTPTTKTPLMLSSPRAPPPPPPPPPLPSFLGVASIPSIRKSFPSPPPLPRPPSTFSELALSPTIKNLSSIPSPPAPGTPPPSGIALLATGLVSSAAVPDSPLPTPPLHPRPVSSSSFTSSVPPPPPPPRLSPKDILSKNSPHVAPVPTPPPPPHLASKEILSKSSPHVPPVPPPPPSSHLSPKNILSEDSPLVSSVPPPPPPPHPASKDILSKNSSHVPPVPPPPAPFANGLSKTGGACSQYHSATSNGNVPPIPGPPFGKKGRLPLRASPRNQDQSRKTPLKPYHWLKLTRAIQGSLWAEALKSDEASKAPEFDMSELESLFAATVPNSDNGSRGGKSNCLASGPKSDKINLIDLRRAYNCEIMLTKVKVPLPELMSSVLALDDSALDIDQVDNLIKFCPRKEEIELLKNYNGDKEKLGKCEQFFLELMKVPRVESKLRVFSFKIQFQTQVSDLRNNLNIVNSVAEEIRNSVKLKKIMNTILSLGNALNHGTARGSAVGFRLDSLLKLADTRTRNKKMTLMHYLCKVLAEKLPELLDFPKDLVNLEASTKIQLKYLAEEMQAISKGLEKVVQELTASQNDGPVSENFCKILKEFLGFAEGEVRSLASLYAGVGRNADALALYFGEDPARVPFEQVVSTLFNFVKMFVRAHDENCKHLELEKKKAMKEAEIEKKKLEEAENEKTKRNTPKQELENEKTNTSAWICTPMKKSDIT